MLKSRDCRRWNMWLESKEARWRKKEVVGGVGKPMATVKGGRRRSPRVKGSSGEKSEKREERKEKGRERERETERK